MFGSYRRKRTWKGGFDTDIQPKKENKKLKKIVKKTATAVAASAIMVSVSGQAMAGDKYLEALEDRLATLERELNIMQRDSKGKNIVADNEVPVYVTPKSKYVDELKISGRVQYQFGYVNSSEGNYSTQEFRRVRLGVEGKLQDDFKFKLSMNLLPNDVSLDEVLLQYVAYDEIQPFIGVVKPRFSLEETTSSARILTIERSNIVNTLSTGKIIGAGIEGELGWFNYSVGVYNGEGEGYNTNTENVNSRYLYNASIGADFGKVALRADYMYSDDDPKFNSNVQSDYQHNFSGSAALNLGRFDFTTEFLWAESFEGDSVWGVIATPSFYLVPKKLQFVVRGEYSEGDSGDSLRAPSRYLRRVTGIVDGGRGDEYYAVYGGLNYYLHGNDLKFMLGAEYSKLEDKIQGDGGSIDGVTVWGAVRMLF